VASLGSLVIELAANTARLQGDLGRAVSMTQTFARGARAALGVFGVGAGGGLLGALARDAIKFGDELQKGAQRAGIGAGAFSQLAAAAKQADVDMGTLSKGLRNLQVAISQAGTRGSEAQKAFRDLGVDLEALRNLSADQQLLKIADALKRLGAEDRARIGAQVLGKAYLELVPLLDQGAAGIRALVEEQRKLGNTFSDEQVRRLAETDDAIKKLSASWKGFATTLTASVAPALTAILKLLTNIGTSGLNESAASIRERLASIEQGFDEQAKGVLRQRLAEAEQREARDRTQRRLEAVSRGSGLAGIVAEQRNLGSGSGKSGLFATSVNPQIQLEFEQNSLFLEQLAASREAAETFRKEVNPQIRLELEQNFQYLSDLAKDSANQMSQFAKQAARGMQDAFADFLFDPFADGVDGMLKSFITVLRRMVAEAAAAKILGPKNEGGLGLGGLISGFVGKLFGFAQGGSFTVGGVGGTDSKLVAFRATPGERVSVSTPGQGGAGVVLNQSIALYGNGGGITATDLAVWGKQVSDATVARLLDMRRRGK
jgi:hypothetical protein